MAGLCFVIQKASSALISNMTGLNLIFLLLFVPELALCSPVTADGPVQTFFCKPKGCAADVTKVFCNNDELLDGSDIQNCSGRPQPNNVCQHGGTAFVSTSTDGGCEFEGDGKYIATENCADLNNTCLFNDPTSSPTVSPNGLQEMEDQTKHTGIVIGVPVVVGVVLLLILLVLAVRWVRKKCRTRQPKQHRAPPTDPGLDDDTSPLQCDNGSKPDKLLGEDSPLKNPE